MGDILIHIAICLSTFLILNSVFKIWEKENEFCVVETSSGRIRGKLNHTLLDERLFYSFRGIPFAKPPVGELRFKAPQIVDPWSDTLDAFEFGKHCYEHISGDIFDGYEDCLYLNVFVPTNSTTIDTNAKLPVMFYIYGGRLVSGASNHYSPDFLMEEDIIVITFNHRMGPFGFLSLQLPEYSGNMGFKDQALALKWVKENIAYFGGDENQITLCGHSSGSSSVHLHVISPHSNHLFQRAIMLSSSALNSELLQKNSNTATIYKLANQLNHPISDEDDLIAFLQNVNGETLLRETYVPLLYPGPLGSKEVSRVWSLAIEDENAINPFLTKCPLDILTDSSYESNIDTLFSVANLELTLVEEQLQPELLKSLNDVFGFGIPIYQTAIDFKSKTYKDIVKRVRDYYFDGKPITLENLNQGHLLYSDAVFLYGIDLSARIQAIKSNARTLFSKFTANNDWNWSARMHKESNYTMIFDDHPDQVYYLNWFSRGAPNEIYFNLKTNPKIRSIVKNTARFYANFVKFGNVEPGVESVPFKMPNSNEYKYYDITNDGIFVKVDEKHDRFDFWSNLLNDYREYLNTTFDFLKLE